MLSLPRWQSVTYSTHSSGTRLTDLAGVGLALRSWGLLRSGSLLRGSLLGGRSLLGSRGLLCCGCLLSSSSLLCCWSLLSGSGSLGGLCGGGLSIGGLGTRELDWAGVA